MDTADELIVIVVVVSSFTISLVVFIIVITSLYQKRRLQFVQEKLALHAQYQQEILKTQIEIQNQTLAQIGQELHDNIGQLLSVARFQLNVLESEQPSALSPQIKEINDVVEQSIGELRALSKSLDSHFVADFGLVESLSHELQRIHRTGKCNTNLDILGEVYRLDTQKEIVLLRIAQETLNNTIKHADATLIAVELHYQTEEFRLIIQDNGRGFDYEAVTKRDMNTSGAGLRNIQRRTQLIGASYHLDTMPDYGTKTTVSIKIP
ncbi:MAG: sensor histidine kinase [Runella sp.]